MTPSTMSSLAALGLALAAAACRPGPQGAETPPLSGVRPREATRVIVAPVVQREMVRRLETTTRIESENQVELYPRASGVVVELQAEEGDRVVVGQVLARLDDRDKVLAEADARAALEQARADVPRLELAKREAEKRVDNTKLSFDQAARDHERNLAIAVGDDGELPLLSQRELDASRLARDQREADYQQAVLALERSKLEESNGQSAIQRAALALERATLELSHMSITAAIGGVVAERSIRVGDSVGPAAAAFVITDPDALRTVFHRPQRELGLFQARRSGDDGSAGKGADLEMVVRAEALPGRTFSGLIERISPTIDPGSGNFRVTARLEPQALDDPNARLLPGMLVRLEIITERHPDALVVAKRAIRREGDRSVVFAVREGLARSVEVREGFGEGDDVEVIPLQAGALTPGEPVVVVGSRDLEDGAPVSVEEQASDAEPEPDEGPASTDELEPTADEG